MAHIYIGKKYILTVENDRFTIECEGEEICSLIPETAVGTVSETLRLVGASQPDGIPEFAEQEDRGEELLSFEKTNDNTFVWTAKSPTWAKIYTLTCDPDGFTYTVTVKGTDSIGKIHYFADGSSIAAKKEDRRIPERHSTYEFYENFSPNPSPFPRNAHRRASGISQESPLTILSPSSFVFSYTTWDVNTRFGLGLITQEGQYSFTHFDHLTSKRGEQFFFHLSINMDGHTKVNGEFTLPAIRAFFGESDMDIVKQYANYHYDLGLCRKNKYRENRPRWWYGPIVCGWHEQYTMMENGIEQKEYATQEVYEHIADEIERHNIRPTLLIIDDKWQRTYGDCLPDLKKWPDMRGFTDKMHARGIHTLLWFRMWGGEGLPKDELLNLPEEYDDWEYGPYADPTSEAYRKHLKEIFYRLLSSDEGCMNCDGFKLDYTSVISHCKATKSKGGLFGVELAKALYTLVYNTAKEIKPDCLINASPGHPYFDEVCDMARLHDCSWEIRDQSARMTERAEICRAALPDVLIDTDSVNYASRPDAMRYFRTQPKIGIPDIYQFSNSCHITFKEEDWTEIEKIFNDYSDRMDRLYGENN